MKAAHEAAAIERLLARNPLLSLLAAPVRRRLARAARLLRVNRGNVICHDGAPAERAWLVISGEVKLVKYSSTGAALLIDLALPPQLFNCVYYRPDPVYPCAAVAMKPSEILSFPLRELTNEMAGDAVLLQVALTETCRKLCRAQQLRALSMERTEVRIAQLLLYLHERFGAAIPETRETMAELAGTTVETAIRTIQKMATRGLVATRRGRIDVRSVAGLRACAAGQL